MCVDALPEPPCVQEYGYVDRIGEMMAKALNRVLISLDELRDYNEDLCRDLMLRPFEHIPALETALREVSVGRPQGRWPRRGGSPVERGRERQRGAPPPPPACPA